MRCDFKTARPSQEYALNLTAHFYRRIRRMGEGNIFSLCVSPHPGGYLSFSRWKGGYLPSYQQRGGIFTFLLMRRYLPFCWWVVPPWTGVTQSRYPLPRVGTPLSKVGTPLPKVGTPHWIPSSTASTCYAAVVLPLAFTHENFPVHKFLVPRWKLT